jgi:hypothetical protein
MTCGATVVGVVLVVVESETRSDERFRMMASLMSAVAPADIATIPAGFTLTAFAPPKPCEASRDIPAAKITVSTTRSLRDKTASSCGL